jgi:hypothetical protein
MLLKNTLGILVLFAFCTCPARAEQQNTAMPATPSPARPLTVEISMAPQADISPLLFGTNYDWNKISAAEFSTFNSFMAGLGVTLMRYPGGFNAEHYDWSRNSESGWKKAPASPGMAPGRFLELTAAQASFITPSEAAVADQSQIHSVAAQAVALVKKYGEKVKIWEIGNEWWMQSNAQKNATTMRNNFENYAALVAVAAPAMKAANPSITVYASLDWKQPVDFSDFPKLVGEAGWAAVDGISIHPYCGTDPSPPNHLCREIPAAAANLRSATGKSRIFASEWAATVQATKAAAVPASFGIRNANVLVLAVRDLAAAGLSAATYWPDSAKEVPQIAFGDAGFNLQFDGALFGMMSRHFTGKTLPTSGDLSAAASLAANGDVTLFIPTMSEGLRQIQVPLAGTSLKKVVSAEVLYADYPDCPASSESFPFKIKNAPGGLDFSQCPKTNSPQIAHLPTELVQTTKGPAVMFTVNPGSGRRGSGWEIVRLTLSPEKDRP